MNVESDLQQPDLELLEQYLDGALDETKSGTLRSRLQTDDILSALLTDLRSQRAVRSAVWQSMEGDRASVSRLMWRVRGAMLQEQQQPAAARAPRFWNQWRIASVGSAAAACLVLGFFFGRFGQNQNSTDRRISPTPTNFVSRNIQTPFEDTVRPAVELASHDAPGTVVQLNPAQPNAVPITNEYGQIVAYQRFATPEQAKTFAEDLHRTHGESNAPAAAGPSKLATEEHAEQVPF